MRTPLAPTLYTLVFLVGALGACGSNSNNGKPQCSDGIDNDGDGLIDFPADPGCTSPEDDSENSPPSPQCSDGRDNDNDGKIADYPERPGLPCSPLPGQRDRRLPATVPNCPQCGNGKDDDNNGLIPIYPNDPGCSVGRRDQRSSTPSNPIACGSERRMIMQKLPFDGRRHRHARHAGDVEPDVACSAAAGAGARGRLRAARSPSPKVVVADVDGRSWAPAHDQPGALHPRQRTARIRSDRAEVQRRRSRWPRRRSTARRRSRSSITTPGTWPTSSSTRTTADPAAAPTS